MNSGADCYILISDAAEDFYQDLGALHVVEFEVFHDFFAYGFGGGTPDSAGRHSRKSAVAVGKKFGTTSIFFFFFFSAKYLYTFGVVGG